MQGAFGPGVSSFIRGIGSGDTGSVGEPAVAFYIDDVYYPVLLGANFDLLDVDHTEVLREPQGTLFGRNSLAGALNVEWANSLRRRRRPATSSFTAGQFERRDVRAGFNLPLSENVALMVSGLSKLRKGYVKRLDFTCEMNRRGTLQLAGSFPTSNVLVTNSPTFSADDCEVGRLGGDDVNAGRVSLLREPASTVRLTFSSDYIRDTSENTARTMSSTSIPRAPTTM